MNRRTRKYAYGMIGLMVLIPSILLALVGCDANASAPGIHAPTTNDNRVNKNFSISVIDLGEGSSVICLVYDGTNGDSVSCDWDHKVLR